MDNFSQKASKAMETPAPQLTDEARAVFAQWGRIGSLESWARTEDRTARTAPAVRASMARFEREVDPEGKLSPEEREKRAAFARKAYFRRLAIKSHEARRRNKNAAVAR